MFGLGPLELLLVVAVVALVGGPSAVKQIARLFQSAQKAKSELTGQALLGRILEPDEKPARPKKRPKHTAKKTKRPRVKRG